MSINIGLRREPKGDETYSVPGFVNRVNGYLDQAPAHFVEAEPGIEYPEGYVSPANPEPQVMDATPQEVTELTTSPRIRDNGLGIMVIDPPAEAVPSASDEQPELNFTSEEPSETVLYKMPVSYKKLASGGLRKVIKAAKSISSGVTNKYYQANTVMVNAANGIHSVGEKLSKLEQKTNRAKVVKALGGLALVGVAAYGTYKGISFLESSHNHQAVHQAAQQVLPTKAPHQAVEVIQHHPKAASPAHRAVQLSVASANKAHATKEKLDEITVKPGEGITQTIKDYYPGKSASQYADAYNKLSAKVGASHIIEGIPKYKMSDGSLGLSHAGPAHWGAHVHSLLQSYFKQPK